ncbi:MAG: hypothetical protein J6A45_01035 [Lachnospiraceae bacterium]|nr:hypothetical protein [Lachnospiraceae bacterium]
MYLLVKGSPQLYHQLKGDIIAEYHLDHYGKYLVVYGDVDALSVDTYHREDGGLWKKENMSATTGDKAYATTTYMETRDGETDFTYIWLYAQRSGILHEETIEVEGNDIQIKSYPVGEKCINVGVCITKQDIGSEWLKEQVETVIRKRKISRSAIVDWVYYPFEEAVEQANAIIYGEITNVSDTFVLETELSNGAVQKDLYKQVTVEVKDVLKGNIKGSEATFYEWGGETDDEYLVIEGYEPVNVNEEYIIYLNGHERLLAGPSSILPVFEDIVTTKGKYAPTSEEVDERPEEMSLEVYAQAVRRVLGRVR